MIVMTAGIRISQEILKALKLEPSLKQDRKDVLPLLQQHGDQATSFTASCKQMKTYPCNRGLIFNGHSWLANNKNTYIRQIQRQKSPKNARRLLFAVREKR